MLPSTAARVSDNTAPEVNAAIRRRTHANLAYFAQHPEEIADRLDELDREWDIERVLETQASSLSLLGTVLGATVDKRFLVLPAVVAAILGGAIFSYISVSDFRRLQHDNNTQQITDLRTLSGSMQLGVEILQAQKDLNVLAGKVRSGELHAEEVKREHDIFVERLVNRLRIEDWYAHHGDEAAEDNERMNREPGVSPAACEGQHESERSARCGHDCGGVQGAGNTRQSEKGQCQQTESSEKRKPRIDVR